MYAERHVVALTTAADGSATGYTPVVTGPIRTIRYVKTDFADGVDFTVTLEGTGETVWAEDNVNASATRSPRQATHSTAGVAALYAAGGTAVADLIVAVRDRVKVVVAAGGNATTGAIHVVVG
ncbi:MAG: hypothetical protein Q7S20_01310 [Gemmatimonadaceae bacterium]|nr:hypothetical protein [Gemmatimonadaceae bacterium]